MYFWKTVVFISPILRYIFYQNSTTGGTIRVFSSLYWQPSLFTVFEFAPLCCLPACRIRDKTANKKAKAQSNPTKIPYSGLKLKWGCMGFENLREQHWTRRATFLCVCFSQLQDPSGFYKKSQFWNNVQNINPCLFLCVPLLYSLLIAYFTFRRIS